MNTLDSTTFLASGPDLASSDDFFAYTSVDTTTGNRTPQPWVGYPHPNGANELGWVAPHPTMNDIRLVVTDDAVLLFDPKSGSSLTLSH